MMESKQNYGQVQCPDCKNFYKNRNSLHTHRSGACVGRNSLKMRRMKETIIIKEEPRPPPTSILRTVLNKQSESPRKVRSPDRRANTTSTPVIKHSKTFSVIRGKQMGAEFNEDDQAYWREFEQSPQ